MASVLLIEDDTQHLEYMREVIEYGGHTAFPAKNTSIALKILEQNQIDFIVTDIYLPGMSGLEFIGFLRKQAKMIPFIIVSGSNDEENKKQARKLKAQAYLTKPLDPETLLKTIVAKDRKEHNK
jgi:CheY-like chemotaxis protein